MDSTFDRAVDQGTLTEAGLHWKLGTSVVVTARGIEGPDARPHSIRCRLLAVGTAGLTLHADDQGIGFVPWHRVLAITKS
jgi:hypothetical protein